MTIETLYSAIVPSLKVQSQTRVIEPAAAAVTVLADGTVSIEMVLQGLRFDLTASKFSEVCKLAGTTLEGFELSVDQAYVDSTNVSLNEQSGATTLIRFAPIRLKITKPHEANADWTRKELWLKGPSVIGRKAWSWECYDFELQSLATDGSSKGTHASAKLTVARRTPSSDFEPARRATLALLSLASRVTCSSFLELTFRSDVLIDVQATPDTGGHKSSHALIPEKDLQAFMSVCTQSYLDAVDDYSLETLLSYYCRSHEDQLAEAKFIFAGVFMEAYKFYWALNVAKLPTKKNASGLIAEFLNPAGKRYKFKELLEMASQHLSLGHTYTFLDDRNALFHTGRSASKQTAPTISTWPALRAELVPLHDQIDDILLTILKYAGPIRSYWSQESTVTFPGRAPL